MLNKDIHQLEKTAIKWWPIEIQELAQQISIIPKLFTLPCKYIHSMLELGCRKLVCVSVGHVSQTVQL